MFVINYYQIVGGDHMFDEIHEECGVFAVVGDENAANLCYFGLHSLQHRGQEAAGILVSDGKKFSIKKGEGLVSEIFNSQNLSKLKGNSSIGHVRYATAGGGGMANVQPLWFKTIKGSMGIVHNGNIINADLLRESLEDQGSIFQSSSDTEILGHLMKRMKGSFVERICQSLTMLDGGFSFLIMIENAIYAARDRYGLRPLCIGKLENGAYILSSETCGLDAVNAKFVRDVLPGEVIRIKDGVIKSCFYTKDTTHCMCAMEYVYFARPDSNIDGINIHLARKNAGMYLAKEAPCDADIVIGVPDSSLSAAIGYSEYSHIPYETGLIKNKYVGRTFIQPTQELREQAVKLKLSAIKSVVNGKRVIMIDDSIVRGTTSKRIVKLLKDSGAKEVHVRIASPAIKFPCFYGVDTSTFDELISNRLDLESLTQYIEADSLAFISAEGLRQSVNDLSLNHECGLCMACFTGMFPTKLYDAFEKANKELK